MLRVGRPKITGLLLLIALWLVQHMGLNRLQARQAPGLSTNPGRQADTSGDSDRRRELLSAKESAWLIGDLEHAVRLNVELFDLESELFGVKSDQIAWRLREMATLSVEQSDTEEALRHLRQSARIIEKLHSRRSWQFEDAQRFEGALIAVGDLPFSERMAFLNAARDYANAVLDNRFRDALKAMRLQIAILSELLGERHLSVQEAVLKSQELLIVLNDPSVSASQLKRLERLIPQISTTPNPVYAHFFLVAATYSSGSGDFDIAETQYRKSIKLYEQCGLPFLPEFAIAVNNYGSFLMQRRRYSEAHSQLLKAQSLLRNQVGFVNSGTRKIEYNLAHLEHYLGKQALRLHQWDRSEEYLQHGLQTVQRLAAETGQSQYMTRDIQWDLQVLELCRVKAEDELQNVDDCLDLPERIDLLESSGEIDRALELSLEYQRLVRELFGASSPAALQARFLVAKYTTDRARKLELLKALGESSSRILGAIHPRHASLLVEIADWSAPSTEETLELAERAVSIYRELSWQETWQYAHALRIVGRIRNALRREDAIEVLLEADQCWKKLRLDSGVESLLTLNEILHFDFNHQRYVEAVPYCERAAALARELVKSEPLLAASTCNQVATVYERLGRTDEALQNYLRAVKLYGESSHAIGRSQLITLKNVAGLYLARQEFASAESYYLRCLKLVENPEIYDRALQIDALLSLTSVYEQQSRFDESRELLKQAALLLEQGNEASSLWCQIRLAWIALELSSEHQERAASLFSGLWSVLTGGAFPPSVEDLTEPRMEDLRRLERPASFTQQEWLGFWRQVRVQARRFPDRKYELLILRVLHEQSRSTADSVPWQLRSAAVELREAEQLQRLSKEQRSILNEAVALRQEALDADTGVGNDELITKLRLAVRQQERVLGKVHSSLAQSYFELAQIEKESGRVSSSISSYENALGISEELWGTRHFKTAEIQSSGAMALLEIGAIPRAERWLLDSIETQTEILGDNHPDLAESQHRLAKFHGHLGNYSEALQLAHATCRRFEAIYGKESFERAQALKTLSMVYSALRSDTQAIYPLLEAMQIVETVSDDEDDKTEFLLAAARQLTQFPVVYGGVFEVLDEIIRRYETSEDRTKEYADALEIRGIMKARQAKFEEAYDSFLAAFRIREKVYDRKQHPKIAQSLTDLGVVSLKLGRLEDAERYLSTAYEVNSKGLQIQDDLVLRNVYSLAEVRARQGKLKDALSHLERCFELDEQSLMSNLILRPEAALARMLNDRFDVYSLLLTLQLSGVLPEESAEFTLSRILRRKGLALDVACQLSAAQNSLVHDQAILAKLAEIQRLRSWLAETAVTGDRQPVQPEGDEGEFSLNENSQVMLRIQTLREEVAFRVRDAGVQLQTMGVDIEQLRAQLPPESALIEFVVSGVIDLGEPTSADGSESHLLAFILPADQSEECRLVDLGPMDEIEPLIEQLRTQFERFRHSLRIMTEEDLEERYRAVGSELYGRLLEPFDAELSGLKAVVIAPDARLHLVPFAALVRNNGHYLIEDLAVSFVSSGRDLLRERAPVGRGTLVLADPDYDASRDQRAVTARSNAIGVSRGEWLAMRGASEIGVRSGLRWTSLPAAREEAAVVERELGSSAYGPVQAFFGADAVEEVFKTAVSPRIIHIATHGFYLPYEQPDEFGISSSADSSSGSALGRLRYAENPLMRSGLVLAGANQLSGKQGRGSNDLEDGWLTAQEIASMDFRNTELIVLSACESGLGDTDIGHGVHGLRRAFLIAGAQSLLSSMFEVPDAETRQLMSLFYRQFAQSGDQVSALQQAQQSMIAQRRQAGKTSHPFFWASFFMIGQPERRAE